MLVALTPPGCQRCGRPLEGAVDRCRDCPPPGPDWTRAGLLYAGPARAALIRLKFAGHRTLARGLAESLALAWRWTPVPPLARPWTVTWVPLGRRRRRQRGFDQARALAGAFARAEGLPLLPLLRRARETGPQARRSGAERRVALHGAFEPAGEIGRAHV